MKVHFCILVYILINLNCGIVCGQVQNNDLLVQIPNGPIRGKEWGIFYGWESIPYAEPPVGELRFEPPQPLARQWTQEYNTTRFADFCMQWYRDKGVNRLRGVEDCLHLNVYRPKPQASYPVLVFIHGGYFMIEGTLQYDPEQIMRSRRAMVVTFNYRLGPLGFLSTEDEHIPGNYGLKDQQFALQWIKANIANFGGDPNRILVMGFSAGGASTHLHLLQPWLKDIAKVAVSMSGNAFNPWVITRNARENAARLAAAVNCTNTADNLEIKRCLKASNATDIVRAVQSLLNFGYNPFTTFGPVVEPSNVVGAYMTQHPEDIIRSGRVSNIPWLVTYTAQDGVFNAAELMRISSRTGVEILNELNLNWLEMAPQNLFLRNINDRPREYAQYLKEQYLGTDNFTKENYGKVQEMYTDILVRNGVLKSMELHRQYSESPLYGYIYDNAANYGIGYDLAFRKDIKFGASHMDDVTLLLRHPFRSTPRQDEMLTSGYLVKMLIDFVETGQLSFGNCNFIDNAGDKSNLLKFVLIGRDTCQIVHQEI